MSLVRVHNFSISLDGFGPASRSRSRRRSGTPANASTSGCSATRYWGEGRRRRDRRLVRRPQRASGIGAEIMGANKFGPPGWQDDPDWKGWWGPRTRRSTRPTYVLTHRPRPPLEMEGGTTFHFLSTPRPRRRSPSRARVPATSTSGSEAVRR